MLAGSPVAALRKGSTKVVNAARSLLARSRGCSPQLALRIYNAVATSRCLYGLPLASLRPSQWETLDMQHRQVIRQLYGLPRNSPIGPTLAEAKDFPLSVRAQWRALNHVERLQRTRQGQYLVLRLHSLPHSCMGRRAAEFHSLVPTPYCGWLPPTPHSHRPPTAGALRIGSVNNLRLLRCFTPSSQNSGLIVTAKFSAPPGYRPRPGLAPHRPGFPGVMADATAVTGYDPTSLRVVTMETTSSDQAMPSEHEYLADMVKLWQRKQSQAAASPKGQGWLPPARPRAALQTEGAPHHLPRRGVNPSGDPAILLVSPSVLPSHRAGDAIRAYLGKREHSSTSCHVWPVWDKNVLVCSVTSLPMAQRLLGDIQLPVGDQQLPFRGHAKASGEICRGVIAINPAETPQRIKSELEWSQGAILAVRKLGDSTAAVVTLEGTKLPRFIYYSVVAYVRPHKTMPACSLCGTIGNRPSACPRRTPGHRTRCGNQVQVTPEGLAQHECNPISAPARMKPALGDAQGNIGNLHHHRPRSHLHPRHRALERLPNPSLDHVSRPRRTHRRPPQCTTRRLSCRHLRTLFFSGKSQLSLNTWQLSNCNNRNRQDPPLPPQFSRYAHPAYSPRSPGFVHGAGCSTSYGGTSEPSIYRPHPATRGPSTPDQRARARPPRAAALPRVDAKLPVPLPRPSTRLPSPFLLRKARSRAWRMTHKILDFHHGDSFIYTFAIISIRNHPEGFGNRRKRSHLLLFLQSRGSLPSVLALQEAGPNPPLSGYCSYIGGTTTNLLVQKSYTAVQVDLDLDLPYDYCMISVLPQKRGAQSIHILNVYCPPHLQRVTFAELFYRALQAAAWQPLVVVGDFNAPSPRWRYHYENARGRKLKELISTLGFTLLTDPAHPTRLKCAKSVAQPASRTGQLFASRLSPCSHPRRTSRHGHHMPSAHTNHAPDAFALTAKAADYSAQLADTNWVDTCMKAAGQMSSKSTWRLFRSLLDPSTTRGETQRQLRRAYYAYKGPTSQLANDLCDRYLCRTVDPKGPEHAETEETRALRVCLPLAPMPPTPSLLVSCAT
ncbi:hypothetical protein HPB49_010729 [Dermacentor silvarum]|uniref:Uncharacterized protein n=1 Tax=Dermacentor silvarum TaxID=543639 RepID=A0ACB8CWT1_DERSI|nr:hypothetical protein HPB49_010729 [Dermacentor silvarum]